MADAYLDHGVYTYAAVPNWGVPQEGDGTSKDPAIASAVVSIDLSAATFVSGSSTVSIMGATALTIGAGANSATNAQYSATLTTMIDNLVVAINLATAVIANKPAGWYAHKVLDAVFARRNGNSLELMTRSGSASWNGLVAVTFANVTGASSGSWSGGSGGCWGWWFNNTGSLGGAGTIWPSAWLAGTYSGVSNPLAGLPDADALAYVRAKNNEVWHERAVGATIYIRTNVCVDNAGLVWPDSLNKTFTTGFGPAGGYGGQMVFGAGTNRTVLSALKRGGLVIKSCATAASSQAAVLHIHPAQGRSFAFRNVLFYEAPGASFSASSSAILFSLDSSVSSTYTFNFLEGCEFYSPRAVNGYVVVSYGGTGGKFNVVINDMDFTFPAASGAQAGLFYVSSRFGLSISNARMNSPAAFGLVRKDWSYNSSGMVHASNVRGFDLKTIPILGNVGYWGTGAAGLEFQCSTAINAGADSAFRIEGNTHIVDWLPGNQYPSLDCTTPAGTPWSWRWLWSGDTNFWIARTPSVALRLNARSLAGTAPRTITLELLVPTGMALDSSTIGMRVGYESPTGLKVATDLTPALTGVAINTVASSAALWDKGGFAAYEAKKLVVTTPLDVVSGSDLVVELVASGPCPEVGGAAIFVNPRVSIA